jgi:hypothetical protein
VEIHGYRATLNPNKKIGMEIDCYSIKQEGRMKETFPGAEK